MWQRTKEKFSSIFLVAFAFAFPLATDIGHGYSKSVSFAALAVGAWFSMLILWMNGIPMRIRWTRGKRLCAVIGLIALVYAGGLSFATFGWQDENFLFVAAFSTLTLCLLGGRDAFGHEAWHSIRVPLAVLTVGTVASSFLSLHQHTAFLGDPYHRTGLLTYLCCALIFLTAVGFAVSARVQAALLSALFIGSVLNAAVVAGQFYFPEFSLQYFKNLHRDLRPSGTLGHTNWMGTYLCLMLPLAATGFLAAEKRIKSVWLALVTAALFMTLLMGQTRGAWVGFAVFWAWLVIRQHRHWRKILLLSALLGAVAIVVVPSKDGVILNRVESLEGEVERASEGLPGAGSGRFGFWMYALEHLPPYILTGSGLDTYDEVGSPDAMPFQPLWKAHSIYFEYALTLGLPVLLLYLWFIWSCVRPERPSETDLMSWGFRASILTYLVQGIFIHDVVKVWPILWLVLALAVVWRREGERAAP